MPCEVPEESAPEFPGSTPSTFHAAVLVPPPIPRGLGDFQVPCDLLNGVPLAEELLALGQHAGHHGRTA
jgi:hypothetical protein